MQTNGAAVEWRFNWKVVLAGALGMSLASVSIFSLGVFMGPLEAEFGWSRAEIALGITFLSATGFVLAPLVGMAIDRWGPRRIGIAGVTAYCAVFAAFSLVSPSLWTWWGLWILVALASAGVKPTVWTAGISSLFLKGRGLAISVILCGSALGSSLTPIIGNHLIEHYGWRAAYLGLAAFWAVLVIPAVVLFFTSATDRSRGAASHAREAVPIAPAGGTAREVLSSAKFLRMGLATFVATAVTISLASSLLPILISLGFSRGFSASAVGSAGIATIIGRLLGGYLLDRVNGRFVGAVSMLLPAAACALLLGSPGSGPVAIVAVLAVGLAMGAEVDAVAYLVTRHFGLKRFGILFGILTSLMALATAIGPVVVSYTYDVTKTYGAVLMLLMPLSLVSSVLFLSMGRYPDIERPT